MISFWYRTLRNLPTIHLPQSLRRPIRRRLIIPPEFHLPGLRLDGAGAAFVEKVAEDDAEQDD
ncbi:hypothetical protein IAQ61_007221 [Plenodomus lingam]|uniref:uncharacterized protein n=1 Tax=Leptosphaeria maculans TaxID=5022 RepID=UPI00331F8697|nr:hypothetical protein IAQ61_007221 [Plenodomus lingam]